MVWVGGAVPMSAGSAFTSGGEKDEQCSGDVGLYPWDDETRVWGIVVVVIWGETSDFNTGGLNLDVLHPGFTRVNLVCISPVY